MKGLVRFFEDWRLFSLAFLLAAGLAFATGSAAAPDSSVDADTWRWLGGGALGLMFLKETFQFLSRFLAHDRRALVGDDTAKIIMAIDGATKQHREAWVEQMKEQREELREMFEAFQEAQKESAKVTRELTSVVERLGANCPSCRNHAEERRR